MHKCNDTFPSYHFSRLYFVFFQSVFILSVYLFVSLRFVLSILFLALTVFVLYALWFWFVGFFFLSFFGSIVQIVLFILVCLSWILFKWVDSPVAFDFLNNQFFFSHFTVYWHLTTCNSQRLLFCQNLEHHQNECFIILVLIHNSVLS